jgi:5'-nucleotidase
MEVVRLKLLITNDDGINAEGIYILAKELEKEHEVIIVAPDNQRSACGHSITLTRPLILREIKLGNIKSKAYSLDGTPADCVRIAVDKFLKGKIDMVISGVNKGVNLGTDVIYSGTVSAAIEAAIYNIPSVAISSEIVDNQGNYELAAKTVAKILVKVKDKLIKNDVVLNINVPLISEKEISGIKVCKIGSRTYDNAYIESKDKVGDLSYEVIGEIKESFELDTDVCYFKEGYITLTPLHYDLTNYKILKTVEEWF